MLLLTFLLSPVAGIEPAPICTLSMIIPTTRL
jgi:hypothetical protein